MRDGAFRNLQAFPDSENMYVIGQRSRMPGPRNNRNTFASAEQMQALAMDIKELATERGSVN